MGFENTGDDIKLTHHTHFGGCAAKIGLGDLEYLYNSGVRIKSR